MAYDALTLSVLTRELNTLIVGGKITKVYQPEKDEIVLYVFNKSTYKLLISSNAGVNRIHVTDTDTENPKSAPSFCMLLRKHVINATITSATQMPYERVIDFGLEIKDELGYKKEMHLIFELTGKTSNIVLTNESYIVLDSIKHLPQDLDSKHIVMNGMKYAFFLPQEKIIPFELDKVSAFLSSCNLPLRTALTENLLGVSQSTVNEIMCGIDENVHNTANNALIISRINSYKHNLDNSKPNVVFRNGTPVDVCPFDYQSVKGDKVFFDTLNRAHDEYYYQLDKTQRFLDKAKSVTTIIKNAISRTEKKLAIQRQSILDGAEMEQMKIYGDLILANLYKINKLDDSVTCENYYTGTTVTIALDRQLTPQQNAQAYYKKYRKLKSGVEHNTKLVEENSILLERLKEIKQSLAYCTETDDLWQIRQELTELGIIKKEGKKTVEPPVKPLKYDILGYTVYVGKNNVQNNHVTFKLAKADDLWLHTQNVHSSHVVIVNDKPTPIPDEVIVQSAEICAYYSQARNGTKIPVDYTAKKNIKKPPKATAGYVIYNTYETILVNPDRHLTNLQK